MPWCPKCLAEYREGFIRCSTCDVPLVDTLPEYTAEPQQETALPDGMTKPIAVFLRLIVWRQKRFVSFCAHRGSRYWIGRQRSGRYKRMQGRMPASAWRFW